MPFDAPFKLGPFSVDAAGRLTPNPLDTQPVFLFRWRGRVVRAQVAQAQPSEGRLNLQTTIGRVPSTASTIDDTLRPRGFALLHWLPRSVPQEWRVALLADHRVRLVSDAQIGLPITAAALITEITQFLLRLGPYLDLLDETGINAPHPNG